MRERYGKLLEDAVTRWDVNFVIGELISELNASHTYRSGGDVEKSAERGVGYLGCDFVLTNGAYRITKIIQAAPWDSEVRSPLARPGLTNVSEGDYLLAVNGEPLDPKQDPWAAFQGLADKPVLLTVNDQPTLKGAREVLVQTLGSEARLRNLAWINENRLRVEQASDGKIGYVYVPDTGQNGQNELVRQFRGQFTKAGLVIDERFNSGGQIPDRFVELLDRPLRNFWGVRDGADWPWPPVAHFGPQAMLINGWSGSGGDCFPYLLQAIEARPADRPAHLGRIDRHHRRAAARGRRQRDRPDLRHLRQNRRVDHRELRRGSGHRSRGRSGRDGARRRPATGAGGV